MTAHFVESLKAADAETAAGRRALGIDLGTKTIGLAVSDVERRIATPWKTLKRTKFTADAAALKTACDELGIGIVVIGLPLNMDGTEGPRAQATRAFARNLARVLDTAIVFWDERLSTVAAERALLDNDLSRKKRAERIDATAAGFILQGALDSLNR